MSTKGIDTSGMSSWQLFQAQAGKAFNGALSLGGKIATNIAYNSPQMYAAGGLAYGVAQFFPGLGLDQLHSGIFVGTAILVHSTIRPLIDLIADMKGQELTEERRRMIAVVNALAITAFIGTVFSLKVSVIKGIFLTAVSYVVAQGALSTILPEKPADV